MKKSRDTSIIDVIMIFVSISPDIGKSVESDARDPTSPSVPTVSISATVGKDENPATMAETIITSTMFIHNKLDKIITNTEITT